MDYFNRGARWYRDPSEKVPNNEITRLPYAVLEVKLQLLDEGDTPNWVQTLINSGMLIEVHKFSKFIHGCAVLLPEEVQALPYWIDDPTLAQSIKLSGAGSLIENNAIQQKNLSQLLLTDQNIVNKNSKVIQRKNIPRVGMNNFQTLEGIYGENSRNGFNYDNGVGTGYYATARDNVCVARWCEWAEETEMDHVTTQKIEPKLFFANERTFMKWLQMAVMMSSIAIGVLAFSGSQGKFVDRCINQ